MIKEKYNGHILEIEDDIENFVADRFQDFNRFVAMDSLIGSDLSAFDQHCFTIMRWCKTDPKLAINAVSNMQQSVHFTISKISPELKSFVCLLHSVDGVVIRDDQRTNEGMDQIIKDLSRKGFKMSFIRNILDRVKKNFDLQFDTLLPSASSDVTNQVYEGILRKSILIMQNVQGKASSFKKDLEQIENDIWINLKPVVFTGKGGREVRLIKEFDNACALLCNYNVSMNPGKMSTFSFYNRLKWVEDQIKALRKKSKKQ